MSSPFPIRLVDYMAVVSCDLPLELEGKLTGPPADVASASFKCSVLDRYPLKNYDKECVIPINFPMFCYSSGWKVRLTALAPSFHPFVLTLVDGTHVYCAVLTVYEKFQNDILESLKANANIIVPPTVTELYRPTSLCILSHWPLFSQFAQFLVQLYSMSASGSVAPVERWVQHLVTAVPLPPPGKISVLFKMPSVTINFVRPTVNSLPLADVPFELLFRALDLQNVLLLWNAVLLEYLCTIIFPFISFTIRIFKVVLHSKHAALLGIVCETITSLLYPFSNLDIPLLPLPLVQYVHCPCPYIIGLNVPSRVGIDIPEEAVVVDLDNNTISLPTPEPPSLPEKQRAKLQKKLKAAANVFEKIGEFYDGFDFCSYLNRTLKEINWHIYFVRRNQATNSASKGIKKKEKEASFDEPAVRSAFLQFFVSVMKSYRKAIVDSTFSLPTFLKSHPASSEEFITHLCTQSQGFLQFINCRKSTAAAPDTTDIVLFDEYIIQKKNRLHHLTKDKDTPFLHDTSQTVVRTFEVPSVDTSNLDKTNYQYDHFPRFSADKFSTNIKPAPQLVDQSTGAFRSRVPNKELAVS